MISLQTLSRQPPGYYHHWSCCSRDYWSRSADYFTHLIKKIRFLNRKQKIAASPPQYQNFHHEIRPYTKDGYQYVQSQKAHKNPAAFNKRRLNSLPGGAISPRVLIALVEKYSLTTFTIATSDGLVFASSGGDDANINAATYTAMETRDPLSKTATVIIPGLIHKGSDLVGIIRYAKSVRGRDFNEDYQRYTNNIKLVGLVQ